MTNSILPFVVTRTTKCDIKSVNLLSESSDPFSTIYQRQKACKLYETILNILLNDKSLYVVDGCSGGGSCGLACISLGIKCGIFEKSGIVILQWNLLSRDGNIPYRIKKLLGDLIENFSWIKDCYIMSKNKKSS